MDLAVDTSLTPMLREIAVAGHLNVAISPQFADSCPQLHVLRVGQIRLTDELADWLVQSCPNLQLLVSMKDVGANNLHRVLGLCSRLSELVVFDVGILVGAVVALCRSLRRLTCNGQDKPAIATLIAVSELSSHLEYFKWNAFVFSPKDGRLELPATNHDRISTAQLSSILGHYSSLERFHLESALSGDMVPLLDYKFAGTLRHLSVDADKVVMTALLQRCGLFLTSLSIDVELFNTTSSLALIAATCPRLVILSLRNFDYIEEEAVLLGACKELKELTVEVHYMADFGWRVLRAVLAARLQLKKLKLVGRFGSCDAYFFRQQARDQQLLPVPVITIDKSSTYLPDHFWID